MEWIMVIALILVGAILLVVELFLMPGTMVVGFLGIIANLLGIGLSYFQFGGEVALTTFGVAGVINAFTIYRAFQKGTWKKVTLSKTLETEALSEKLSNKLEVGDTGVSISALRPIGTADFEGETYEVTAKRGLIEAGKPLSIVKISGAKIYVKEQDSL